MHLRKIEKLLIIHKERHVKIITSMHQHSCTAILSTYRILFSGIKNKILNVLRQETHNWMVSVGVLSPWKFEKKLFKQKNIQPLTVDTYWLGHVIFNDFFILAYFVLPWQPIKVRNHKIYMFCNWLLQINQMVNFPFSFISLLQGNLGSH